MWSVRQNGSGPFRYDTESPVVPLSLLVSMVVEGSPGNRGMLPIEHEHQTLIFPALPGADITQRSKERAWM